MSGGFMFGRTRNVRSGHLTLGVLMPANRRWDAKRDGNEASIVTALEAAGAVVYRQLPVDLLVRLPRDPAGVLRCLEVKMPGASITRKDRKDQQEFCATTGTAYVTSPEAALSALGLLTAVTVTE